ncbi:polysaccharide biosynthesis/export family protein [uncultured Mucilaginibacter sp.]|uniref:polysaccharide biosynthesis/export family protein n=1 Tax=uncultured Mucilaginibacter sp. TaxID=797541 RepID=UPI0025FA1DA7|nr:polysaccharide biosynthesis/export family protein [uncultured Mucilaginibacter sp.]
MLFLEYIFKTSTVPLKKLTIKLRWHFMLIILIMSSCSSIKNVKYFSNIPDTQTISGLANVEFVNPKILPDDILFINIQTVDPNATQVLSMGNVQNAAIGATSTGSTGGQTVAGYHVDHSGYVELPVLGKLKVSGLTTEQAREIIRVKAAKLYKDPTVNLKYANFKITVLGEVAKPGTYVVSNEKVNILDALGLAGDLTIYGKRENIVLIRQEEDGSRKLIKLDITNSEILNSPYYYLRQNDYLYIEPSKSKAASSDAIQNRNISIISAIGASLISVIAILVSTN